MFGIYQGDLSPLYSMGALPYDADAVAEVMPDSLDDECAAEICYECFCMEQGFHAYVTNANDLRRFCKDYWCVALSVSPPAAARSPKDSGGAAVLCSLRSPCIFPVTPTRSAAFSCRLAKGSSSHVNVSHATVRGKCPQERADAGRWHASDVSAGDIRGGLLVVGHHTLVGAPGEAQDSHGTGGVHHGTRPMFHPLLAMYRNTRMHSSRPPGHVGKGWRSPQHQVLRVEGGGTREQHVA